MNPRPSVYPPVRRRPPRIHPLAIVMGCLGVAGVCMVAALVGLLVLLPRLPGVAAQVAGLEAEGETNSVLAQAAQAAPPLPTPVIVQPAQPAQVTVNLGGYGAQTVDTSSAQIVVGQDAQTGRQTAVVTFTEANLMDLCRLRSPLCQNADPQYQNVRLDLRPGGAVVYADVNVPTQYGVTISQPLGVVLTLDPSRRQFVFEGVDLDGQLYSVPPEPYGATVAQFESTGNDILRQLTLDAGGGTLALDNASIDDSTITLVMR